MARLVRWMARPHRVATLTPCSQQCLHSEPWHGCFMKITEAALECEAPLPSFRTMHIGFYHIWQGDECTRFQGRCNSWQLASGVGRSLESLAQQRPGFTQKQLLVLVGACQLPADWQPVASYRGDDGREAWRGARRAGYLRPSWISKSVQLALEVAHDVRSIGVVRGDAGSPISAGGALPWIAALLDPHTCLSRGLMSRAAPIDLR